MPSNYCLLDAAVHEEEGEDETTYVFHKEDHAKCLMENLAGMQANEELLTDIEVCTHSRKYSKKFHCMLLASCSPVVKNLLIKRAAKLSQEPIVLNEMTKELLKFFRCFIYQSKITVDREALNLEDLYNFAVKYDIDFLRDTCEQLKNVHEKSGSLEVVFHDHEAVLCKLFEMFCDKELTTTLLEDKNGETQCEVHGALIAAASPILMEVLGDGRSSPGDSKSIRLEISPGSLHDFVEYIYCAEITLNAQNIGSLLRAACIYQLPALARTCCDWLMERLDTFDVVGILALARELASEYAKKLEEAVMSYIVRNFSDLQKENELNSLLFEDLKEIIENEALGVESEEDVFYAIMSWIENDEASRLPFICELLPCICLEHTNMDFLQAVETDDRIGKCSRCFQELKRARQKLAPAATSTKTSLTTSTVGEEETDDDEDEEEEEDVAQAFADATSSYSRQQSESTALLTNSSVSESFEQDCSLSFNEQQAREINWRPNKGVTRNNREGSTMDEPYEYIEDRSDDASRYSPEPQFLNDCDGLSSVSAPDYQTWPQPPLSSKNQPGKRLLRKDGQPDMRCRENRQLYLEDGKNKNGSPDARIRENRVEMLHAGPLTKKGNPDMRYKVNKDAFGGKAKRAESGFSPVVRQRLGPSKKDGTLDMRYKINREAVVACSYPSGKFNRTLPGAGCLTREVPYCFGVNAGPKKKDGTPDMRFKVNKQLYASSPAPCSSPRGPLKKNGTPDMRYAVNKQGFVSTPLSSTARGPLKKNGTPDMRYKANKRS